MPIGIKYIFKAPVGYQLASVRCEHINDLKIIIFLVTIIVRPC